MLLVAASACKSSSQAPGAGDRDSGTVGNRDSAIDLSEQQSCEKSTNAPACDFVPPTMAVSSAPGGPLLAEVRVTSGSCEVLSFPCPSGCDTILVSWTFNGGSTCDLTAFSTDGRSEAFQVSFVNYGPSVGMCCSNGSTGYWTTYTPEGFQPSVVVVDFDRAGGVATVDAPVVDAVAESESGAGTDSNDPTNPPGTGQPCHTHADCPDPRLLCFIEAVTPDCQSAPLGQCMYAQTSNCIVWGPCNCLTNFYSLCNTFPGTTCNRVSSSTDASASLSCLACVPTTDGGG